MQRLIEQVYNNFAEFDCTLSEDPIWNQVSSRWSSFYFWEKLEDFIGLEILNIFAAKTGRSKEINSRFELIDIVIAICCNVSEMLINIGAWFCTGINKIVQTTDCFIICLLVDCLPQFTRIYPLWRIKCFFLSYRWSVWWFSQTNHELCCIRPSWQHLFLFRRRCLTSGVGQPRKLWKVFSSMMRLDRVESAATGKPTAQCLLDYFIKKINDIRQSTGSSPPSTTLPPSPNEVHSFHRYSSEEIWKLVVASTTKSRAHQHFEEISGRTAAIYHRNVQPIATRGPTASVSAACHRHSNYQEAGSGSRRRKELQAYLKLDLHVETHRTDESADKSRHSWSETVCNRSINLVSVHATRLKLQSSRCCRTF